MRVSEAMTRDVRVCTPGSSIRECAAQMAGIQVRRLAVVNREKRLVGIVSLGDLAQKHG